MTEMKPQLTPEEDSIGDPDEQDDEIDDLLPADLWFLRDLNRADRQSTES